MGTDKALFEIQGRPMVQWVADAMVSFDQVVVAGRRGGLVGLETIPDLHRPARGPLSGLQTALTVFRSPLVVVAVDQPLVRPETLAHLAERAARNETVICVDGRPQVTCAAYASSCLDEANRQLGSGGSLQRMLDTIPWTPVHRSVWSSWGEDGRSWFSMDTPGAIIEAEQRFRLNLLG